MKPELKDLNYYGNWKSTDTLDPEVEKQNKDFYILLEDILNH